MDIISYKILYVKRVFSALQVYCMSSDPLDILLSELGYRIGFVSQVDSFASCQGLLLELTSLFQYLLLFPEVHIVGGHVAKSFVVSHGVVVKHEVTNLFGQLRIFCSNLDFPRPPKVKLSPFRSFNRRFGRVKNPFYVLHSFSPPTWPLL